MERTFLIADIRGYTQFTRERGDAAAARLARVFAALARDAVAARGGRVIELRGDEALAVFGLPGAAVRAAIDLVATCMEEQAADPSLALNVGLGIDVGEAVPVEDGYRGAVLNRAARLCSSAAGGQVLVTAGVAARAAELEGIEYASRGAIELKGFEAPVEVLEATSREPSLASDLAVFREPRAAPLAPELQTAAPLSGREHELAWLRGTWRQVRRGHGQLVFLSGDADSGKTRLAAELAAFARNQGALVSYAGAGGVALALAAIEDAENGRPRPRLLILDELDQLGEAVVSRLDSDRETLESGPTLVLCLTRDLDRTSGLRSLMERCDSHGDGHRAVGPLTSAEVREIAQLYAGVEVEEVPFDALERATDRLPGRVHAVMSKWPDLGLEPRRRGAIIVTAALLALAITIAVVAITAGSGGIEVTPNSVAVLDASSADVIGDVPVGKDPTSVSRGLGGVWVANTSDQSISHIVPKTMRVVGTTAPQASVDGLAAGAGGIWTTDVHHGVTNRLDPAFPNPAATIRITPRSGIALASLGPVATSGNAVWATTGESSISRINPKTNRVQSRVGVGNGPSAIATGPSGVWVTDNVDNTVFHVKLPAIAKVKAIPVGEAPGAVALGAGAVWVANSQDDTVSRIDPETERVTATIPVGQNPSGVTVGAGSVWVANSISGDLSQIDPKSNAVVKTIDVGESPQSLVFASGRVWVTVDASRTPGPAAGGGNDVVRIPLVRDPADLDPAQYGIDPQRSYATCALLYNYPDEPAPRGARLQPEAAAGPPVVSDGGRTYAFTVREGFRFSPPSPQPVTAAAFQRAIERDLSPRANSYAATFMEDIVGARAYTAGHTKHLAGVSARGNKLVVRLARPSQDLVARLSTPWFCAIPPNTPLTIGSSTVVPSAGPYYVASYTPNESIVLKRNPGYGGDRPARVAEIRYTIGASPDKAIDEVKSGEADYYSNDIYGNDIAPEAQKRLAARYGPGTDIARTSGQQYFVEPGLDVYSLMFNTTRPPFDDARYRRAVNYALDRRALSRQPLPGLTARPTDQLIPPGAPGFRDALIYPLGRPDVDRARALIGNAHQRIVLAACNQPACVRFARTVRKNLASIGLAVKIDQFPIDKMFARENTLKGFDLGFWGWAPDYADPADFINEQFDPRLDPPWPFHDRIFERRMHAASALSGAKRYDAYARLEHSLVRQAAPSAPFASGTAISFVSSRVGCEVDQPIYGIDLGRLCIDR